MDSMTMAAASGMKARMESLEMLANNLANQTSSGYKADREFYSLYVAPEALEQPDPSLPTTAPVIERQWTDFAQGTLVDTGNSLDLALSGKGFFTVDAGGTPLYTRSGQFLQSPGGSLQTQEGYGVLDASGKPIQLNTTDRVELTPSGQIRQGGAVVAQLGVVDFPQPETLAKQAGTYFRLADPASKPEQASGAVVYQGKLETSNYSPAESAVRLVSVLRQFEMLQKAIQIGSEMGRRADDVARIGS